MLTRSDLSTDKAPSLPITAAVAVAGMTTLIVVVHNAMIAVEVSIAASVGFTLALTSVTLAAAHRFGLTQREVGLDLANIRRGTPTGPAVAALIIGAVTITGLVGLIPAESASSIEEQVVDTWFRILFVIPVGVALCEEVLFRGVLLAAWDRVLTKRWSTIITSVAFGAWHFTVEQHRLGADATLLDIAPALIATTSASAFILCPLRRHTGSVAAPILVHATTNASVLLATSLA